MSVKEFLKIEFGKYINNLPNTINSEHIIPEESGMITRSIEPGEPNLPTKETFKFVLSNLAPDGTERYPFTYWENQARSQAEGAIMPLQIYFRISVDGGQQFLGMMKKLSYTIDNADCVIEVGDALEVVRNSKKDMLTSFEFETRCLSRRTTGQTVSLFGGNDLDDAKSIDAVDIAHASLVFELSRSAGNGVNDSDIAVHLGWDNTSFTDYREIVRSAWVQIEEITLLTHVRFFQRNISGGDNVIYIEVWHNDEDSITVGTGPDQTEIPPGGQFVDRSGEKIIYDTDPNNKVTMVLHEPNLGNGTPCALHIDDTDLDQNFIFGVPYTPDTGFIQITSATYSYFNVVSLVTSAFQNEIDSYHSDSGEAAVTMFDTSRVSDSYKHAFWADIAMFGFAEENLAEALVSVARQVNAWMYTDRFGKIVLHSRDYSDGLLLDASNVKLALNAEWRKISGNEYESGFATFEAEIPKDIVQINNLISKTKKKIWADQNGAVSGPSLRNKPIKLSNFRLNDLGVPIQSNPYGLPVLRYSPDDASWPNAEVLSDFLPLPQTQLQLVADSFSWPTAVLKAGFPIEYSNLEISGSPAALDYLKDENDQLWWVRDEAVDVNSMEVECELQLKGDITP